MPRSPLIATPPPGTTPQQPNTVIQSAVWNAAVDDIYNLFNTAQPVEYGGTAATNVADARNNLQVVSYASQTLLASEKAQARSNISASQWEQIGDVVSASGFTQVAWIDLPAYRFLRVTYDIYMVGNTTGLVAQASTTNGVSWVAGPTSYRYQGTRQFNGGTPTATAITDATFIPLAGDVYSSALSSGSLYFAGWNVGGLGTVKAESNVQGSTGWAIGNLYTLMNFAGTRNALRIFTTSGTFSGKFALEGIRG